MRRYEDLPARIVRPLPAWPRILRLLKHSNRRYSRSSRANAFRCVFLAHSTDRHHRNCHAATNFRQSRDSLRLAHAALRRRIENRAEKNVARARTLRFARFLHAVARNSHQKFRRSVSAAAPAHHFPSAQRFPAQMYARGSCRERHVHPVVHDHSRSASRSCCISPLQLLPIAPLLAPAPGIPSRINPSRVSAPNPRRLRRPREFFRAHPALSPAASDFRSVT